MAEGQFQVATGAVLVRTSDGKVLLMKRADNIVEAGLWEYPAGRLEQFEDIEEGLRREIKEEAGITDIEVVGPIRTFTYMRGGDKAENEVKGIVFVCRTKQDEAKISDEHSEYQWLDFDEALKVVKNEGIRQDLIAARKRLEEI